MSASDDILARAEQIHRAAEGSYRDALLEVGHLLHAFLLAYLREGDGLPYADRKQAGARTRARGIRLAAERLGVIDSRIGWLIKTTMAVDLLSEGGNAGALTWSVLRRFCRFIKRVGKTDPNNKRETTEHWIVKPGFEETARNLFAKAVTGGLTQRSPDFTLAGEVLCYGHETRQRIRITRERQEALSVLQEMSKAGNPRDIAELLFDAVKESPAPVVLMEHLGRLVKEEVKRKRPNLYEAG